MSKLIDLTGQKFERLTVVERFGSTKSGIALWKCKCECGNNCVVRSDLIKTGKTKSCGCLVSDTVRTKNKTHNKSFTRIYRIWSGIKTRCCNENNHNYHKYGARGITLCDEWLHDFQAFYDWSMLNGYADNLTIDRINNDKGYSPDNCRWTTVKVQANNTRRNHYITYNGKTQTLSQWANEKGIKQATLWARINESHWSIEKALNTP